MAILLALNFNGELNASLQVGDIAYYAPNPGSSAVAGFNTVNTNNIIAFGIVSKLDSNPSGSTVYVIYDNTIPITDPVSTAPAISKPAINDYIMFGKDKKVNSSSLIGYYAEVKFVNNSKEKAELFSVGSEVSESSK
jgi:hypothetical protein